MQLVHYRIVQTETHWQVDIRGRQYGEFRSRADAVQAAILMICGHTQKTKTRWVRRLLGQTAVRRQRAETV
jgi:hypothetical protein